MHWLILDASYKMAEDGQPWTSESSVLEASELCAYVCVCVRMGKVRVGVCLCVCANVFARIGMRNVRMCVYERLKNSDHHSRPLYANSWMVFTMQNCWYSSRQTAGPAARPGAIIVRTSFSRMCRSLLPSLPSELEEELPPEACSH